MTYRPHPIDTSQVTLNDSIAPLTEQLAESSHDVWAAGRIREGWTHGPRRDDRLKTTPTLVPYSELPESEKEYDRATALGTLKAILALGYEIIDPKEDPGLRAARVEECRGRLLSLLSDPALPLSDLMQAWRKLEPEQWGNDPVIFEKLARKAVGAGEIPLCMDTLAAAEKAHPGNPVFRYLSMLASCQAGDYHKVRTELHPFLESESAADLPKKLRIDFLSLVGRTYKEEWQAGTGADGGQKLLSSAYEWYRRAYEESDGDIFPGINAVTMANLAGLAQQAQALGETILASCDKALLTGPPDYWALATRAEALLNLGRKEEAFSAYQAAAEAEYADLRDLASSRKQARYLCELLFGNGTSMDAAFSLPCVVVFAGHMIDQPGHEQRFPSAVEGKVGCAIAAALAEMKAGIVFCSAAAGSDILCLEAARQLGAETHVLLSSPRADFRKESVEVCGEGWAERYERALDRTASLREVNRHHLNSNSIAYEYSTQILLGMAGLRAKRIPLDLSALAVWNGEAGYGPGGTESFVAHCRQMNIPVRILNPVEPGGGDSRPRRNQELARPSTAHVRTAGRDQVIKAMLFSDVVKFSSLREAQIPLFLTHFMGLVSRLISTCDTPPIINNTWGDALYMVFDDVAAAARFALALRDAVSGNAWEALGLPPTLNIRTALHAGPVFPCVDPVTRHVSYTGSHVTFTARMEPVTEPGQVFASEAFGSLLFLASPPDCICSYHGQIETAKKAGRMSIYRLDNRVKQHTMSV